MTSKLTVVKSCTTSSSTPSVYKRLLQCCADGYHAAVVASPSCSTFSLSLLFFCSGRAPNGGPPPACDRVHVLDLSSIFT
eukprot:6206038-Pleurochrysis_carterae.AAC.2